MDVNELLQPPSTAANRKVLRSSRFLERTLNEARRRLAALCAPVAAANGERLTFACGAEKIRADHTVRSSMNTVAVVRHAAENFSAN